jgi:hypothetical protein
MEQNTLQNIEVKEINANTHNPRLIFDQDDVPTLIQTGDVKDYQLK